MTDLVPLAPAALVPTQPSGVDDAVQAWLRSFPNEGTRRSFAHAMTLWRAYLHRIGRDLADPHPVGSPDYNGPRRVDANAWRDELRDTISERTGRKLSGKTVDSRLIAIRSFYEFLCEEGALEVNPIQHAKLLSRASPRKMVGVERSAWDAAQAAATERGENLTRQTNLFLRRYARPRRSETS
jgi:hypothetical protein